MSKFIQATIAAVTLAIMFFIAVDEPIAQNPREHAAVATISDAPGALMNRKMKVSQQVLEGLLRKDFDAISAGAIQMRRISEDAEWPRARDRVYEHFGTEFRRQCNQLERLSKQRNLEGTTFVYLQMTSTCVQCHSHARDSLRVAELRARDNVQRIPSTLSR